MVVVKSLGMGFHLPVDGIRSLSLVSTEDVYICDPKNANMAANERTVNGAMLALLQVRMH